MKTPARPPAAREAPPERPTAKAFLARLNAHATAAEQKKYERYFPLAARRPGDLFIGVRMGTVFELARAFVAMPPAEIEKLMESEIHEARAGAMSVMAKQYQAKATTEARRQELFDLYLRRHDRINDWDLVDLAAYYVIGPHLVGKPRDILHALAKSSDPWERRTAILATFSFIRRGHATETLKIARMLLAEPVELVQKAVGWALRGVPPEEAMPFLDRHAARMPRAMLRNAIEKFPPDIRKHYLALRETP
jgi:3-methyladenine DNA glycosylase AlkD